MSEPSSAEEMAEKFWSIVESYRGKKIGSFSIIVFAQGDGDDQLILSGGALVDDSLLAQMVSVLASQTASVANTIVGRNQQVPDAELDHVDG